MRSDKDITSMLDMAERLDLVPVETDTKNATMLVLGIRGNLFKMTFDKIKSVYTSYVTGNIGREYYTKPKKRQQ